MHLYAYGYVSRRPRIVPCRRKEWRHDVGRCRLRIVHSAPNLAVWVVCAVVVSACESGGSSGRAPTASRDVLASASPVTIIVSRSEVGKHDRFLAMIKTRHTTGVNGKTRRN